MTEIQKLTASEQEAADSAFHKFVDRCEMTLEHVFKATGDQSVELRGWLYKSAATPDAKLDTMHTEPLYIVAEFLGRDETTQAFEQKAKKYRALVEREGWDHPEGSS